MASNGCSPWSGGGRSCPYLSLCFGEHYGAFQQAVQQKRAAGQRGGAVMTQQPDLVMLSRGRMGRSRATPTSPPWCPPGLTSRPCCHELFPALHLVETLPRHDLGEPAGRLRRGRLLRLAQRPARLHAHTVGTDVQAVR